MRTYLREAEVTYRRAVKLPENLRRKVSCSRDIAPVLTELIGARMTESFLVVALSTRNEIVGYHEVARGAVSSCPVAASDVFRYPIVVGAPAILIAHNHPSGMTDPSEDDVVLTHKLAKAAELLGITLLDHIIVGEQGYTSLLDAGLMERGG